MAEDSTIRHCTPIPEPPRTCRKSTGRSLPAGLRGCGNELPAETWMLSTPASISHRQTCTDSSTVLPGGSCRRKSSALLYSVALIFICRWKSDPTRAREG